jgi:chemotaxis-related protein WspD
MTDSAGDILSIAQGTIHAQLPGEADCWSRIGVSGDRSCPELSSFVHCRNCPVFGAAARAFFDRPAPQGYLSSWSQWLANVVGHPEDDERRNEIGKESESVEEKVSVLIFRLGAEWLAFRTQTVAEVTTPRPIHRVPKRTNHILLGLVNLQGQVQLCVSLHGLLGAIASTPPTRLVVLRDRNYKESWAFGSEEVMGVHRVSRSQWRSVPATLANPAVGFSQAVLSWKEHSVGLLDEERIFTALRSFEA